MKLICYLIFFPIYSLWLLFCGSIGVLGLIWKPDSESNVSEEVEKTTTICRLLNEKGLLTDEEYQFETKTVAPYYDRHTFKGYRLIMSPVFNVIRNFEFLDQFIVFLVKKWMSVHRFVIEKAQKPASFYLGLAKVCVAIAQSVGRGLELINQLSRLRIRM